MEEWLRWVVLGGVIGVFLFIDLGIFHRKSRKINLKKAVLLSLFWVVLSLLFNLWIYFDRTREEALLFFTGYLLEKSLSVDNLFVFSLIFTYFKVPHSAQHRVLYFGILGALAMRLTLILAGVALVARFEWLLYILGAFLAATGIRMLMQKEHAIEPEKNVVLSIIKRFVRITPHYDGNRFFTRKNGIRFGTPLLVALVAIETSDLVFALDSIPAIFAITLDPFVVFSSNIFAILGLRSLYFVLATAIDRFYYLKQGISAILILVGLKMIVAKFIEIPTVVTLAGIAFILSLSIFLSRRKTEC